MIHADRLAEILPAGSVPQGLATLSLAVSIGIAAGNLRIRGIRFGVAAVLFSALLFAQAGLTINSEVLAFLRDFALVLFVYALGLQMGPGFFASLKAEGLRLNILAITVVVLGALTAALIGKIAHLPREVTSGLYTGGFATTPALAAGQEAIRAVAAAHHLGAATTSNQVKAADLAYSVAYPFGLAGPILLVILFRWMFGVKVQDELKTLAASEQVRRPPIAVADIEVTNPQMVGVSLREQCFLQSHGVTMTRMLRDNQQSVPTATTSLAIGDVFRAVGPKAALDQLVALLGKPSQINLAELAGDVKRAKIVVTNSAVLGKSLRELDLINQYGVTIGGVLRAGVELPIRAGLTLHFGDTVTTVGPTHGLMVVEQHLGNSADALNQTQLIPIFIGIWLGVIAGSVPLVLPGLGTSVKIGLAGGPMMVAILLSRLGNVGSVVWYMPVAANQILRDFGMAVFLACVGFQSGDHFFQKLIYGGGLPLVGWGIVITTLPMFLVGLFARLFLKMNFVTLAGLISGSMTSSPTLLFANEATGSTAPALAYAAVYPMAMLVPVFCSQFLVTLFLS
jgi:putative transport protein